MIKPMTSICSLAGAACAGFTLIFALGACAAPKTLPVDHPSIEQSVMPRPAWFAFSDMTASVTPCANPEYFEAEPKSLPGLLEGLPACAVVTLLPGHYAEMMPLELEGLTLRCKEPPLLDGGLNPQGCFLRTVMPVRIGSFIIEDMIFNGIATNYGDHHDYGVALYIVEQARIFNNVFSGMYNHDISTKENVGLTEIENNVFINCERHCIEVGQNGNVASRPQQSGTMVVRRNRFITPALHAITQRTNSLLLIEDNSFQDVAARSIQNWPYWQHYDAGQGPEELILPQGPLRTIIRNNRFEGANRLQFEGRGITDDSVLIQANSGFFDCTRLPLTPSTAEAHQWVETSAPPQLDPQSDVACPVE